MAEMPPLINKLQMPRILWYQNDLTIIIRIMLHDIKNYFLRVEGDHFRFSTVHDGNKYYICLRLYGAVIPEETSHVNIGREIKVYLTKAHKWTGWLRLPFDNYKYTQIAADPEHIYETSWTEKKQPIVVRDFSEYKRMNGIGQIMPDVPSSDEEESDDEKYDAMFE